MIWVYTNRQRLDLRLNIVLGLIRPFRCSAVSLFSNVLPEKIRDYFSHGCESLSKVLRKKYVAIWQRRTNILRTVSPSQTHISPKITVGCH